MRSQGVKSAVLVIDVQQGLFERSTPVYHAEQMLENINALVERAHHQGILVVYIQHSNEKLLLKGTRAWQFHPEIRLEAGDLHIHKQHGNAFQKTTLHNELQNRNIDRLIVTGMVTQGCVRATCLGGLELGYQVVLARDAHSTYSKGPEKVIKRWHGELSETGVTLSAAKEISS